MATLQLRPFSGSHLSSQGFVLRYIKLENVMSHSTELIDFSHLSTSTYSSRMMNTNTRQAHIQTSAKFFLSVSHTLSLSITSYDIILA